MPIKLIVGLGNPGEKYERTRHNIGSRVALALRKEPDFPSDIIFVHQSPFYDGEMMNEQGRPIQRIANYKNIDPAEIFVVLDDFSIPFESLRIRLAGSSGGHNGLDSILNAFQTDAIPRLRIGIGPVPEKEDPKDFVLKKFSKGEEAKIESTVLPGSLRALKSVYEEGLETAMNKFNGPLTPTLSPKGRGGSDKEHSS